MMNKVTYVVLVLAIICFTSCNELVTKKRTKNSKRSQSFVKRLDGKNGKSNHPITPQSNPLLPQQNNTLLENFYNSFQDTNDEEMKQQLKKLIEEKEVSVDAINSYRNTFLELAAFKGNLESVKYLVTKGAKVNHQDLDGDTALHEAIKHENEEIAKYLIDQGADTQIRNEEGKTILHIAAQKGNVDFMKYLIDKNPSSINISDTSGMTPLHVACWSNNCSFALVKSLIDKGASVNTENIWGELPLHYACEFRGPDNLESIRYLINKSSESVAKLNKNNQIPLFYLFWELENYLQNPYAGELCNKQDRDEEEIKKTLSNYKEIIKVMIHKNHDILDIEDPMNNDKSAKGYIEGYIEKIEEQLSRPEAQFIEPLNEFKKSLKEIIA